MHACEMETAPMLATRPDLVQMAEAKDHFLDWSPIFAADLLTSEPLSGTASFRELSETGVIGAPILATAERGQDLLAIMTRAVAAFMSDLATWQISDGPIPNKPIPNKPMPNTLMPGLVAMPDVAMPDDPQHTEDRR